MVYEKECPICGVYFKTETKIRKYCDKCISGSGRKAQQTAIRIRKSMEEYRNPTIVTYTCELCGKEHSVQLAYVNRLKISCTSKYSWDENDHYYCCIEHLDKDKHNHARCSNCGKELKDCNYSYSPFREYNYCSADCEYIHQDAIATLNGWKHQCVRCGKEFIRKTTKAYFCSQECSRIAKKNGWISPESEERKAKKLANQVEIQHRCKHCGKSFYKTYNNKIDAEIASRETQFCCRECRNAWYDDQRKKKQVRKVLEVKTKKAANAPQRQDNEPLCTTCRTSYKKCERMQSDFTVLPEGAHYNSNGILVECPKYTGR